MPIAPLDEVSLFYKWSGAPEAPVLLLSNSLGTDLHLWDTVVQCLGDRFHILRYDTRGHGRSEVPTGPATLAQLTADAIALMDHLSIPQAAVGGVSLGGLTALSLLVHHPARFTALIAANTAARIGSAQNWSARMAHVEQDGLAALTAQTLTRWFTPAFLTRHEHGTAPIAHTFRTTSPAGYIACCAALRDADLTGQLAGIRVPTLLITGTADPVTPPAEAHALRAAIPGSTVVELSGAHLTVVENASEFANAILNLGENHG